MRFAERETGVGKSKEIRLHARYARLPHPASTLSKHTFGNARASHSPNSTLSRALASARGTSAWGTSARGMSVHGISSLWMIGYMHVFAIHIDNTT